MNVKKSILECIGNTPLVELNKIKEKYNLNFNLYAKVERFNASGSIKDRASLYMLKNALESGKINKDTLIIEPTSGNTGIGLAMICAYLGMKLHIYMLGSASVERIKMMQAYGAEVILTDAKLGMKGAIDGAIEEHERVKNSFIPSQFDNEDNSLAHVKTTGPEIDKDLDGKVDVIVAGIGTGGTISGLATYFKKDGRNVKIVGVEPESSPVLTKGIAGSHKLQGLGANFVPSILKRELLDKIVTVSNENGYLYCNELAKLEGIFAGISSGAALSGAIQLSKIEDLKGKNVVIILPDNGERYLSVDGLFR